MSASSGSPHATVRANLFQLAGAPSGRLLWKLDDAEQLQANLVHLAAGEEVGRSEEDEVEVVLVVVAGDGTAVLGGAAARVRAGDVLVLPVGDSRSLQAGLGGLTYLTVHRRREGLGITRRMS